jgi:hypothetical protein
MPDIAIQKSISFHHRGEGAVCAQTVLNHEVTLLKNESSNTTELCNQIISGA